MLDYLHKVYHRLIERTALNKRRYLYDQLDIHQRLTGIVGPRGVGKTTLMLQYIKQHLYDKNNTFYFSADHIYFNQISLLAFISELYENEAIRIFFIDEIHKYKHWDQELKNLYDGFPDMTIVFSGSSSIDLIHGSYDLSRRARLLHLPGLSFREYLYFVTGEQYPAISYQQLIDEPGIMNHQLMSIKQVMKHFKHYLCNGYYPFMLTDGIDAQEKLLRTVEKSIFEDIASFYQLKTDNLHYFKKICYFLATIPPGNTNTHNIANSMGIDDKTARHYLHILSTVGLVRTISSEGSGHQPLRRAQKIMLSNTSLLTAIANSIDQEVNKGMLRELFFLQTLSDSKQTVRYSKVADFRIHDVVFEIGGKNKTHHQLKSIQQATHLVKDDILTGSRYTLPLITFGFLY